MIEKKLGQCKSDERKMNSFGDRSSTEFISLKMQLFSVKNIDSALTLLSMVFWTICHENEIQWEKKKQYKFNYHEMCLDTCLTFEMS